MARAGQTKKSHQLRLLLKALLNREGWLLDKDQAHKAKHNNNLDHKLVTRLVVHQDKVLVVVHQTMVALRRDSNKLHLKCHTLSNS